MNAVTIYRGNYKTKALRFLKHVALLAGGTRAKLVY